MKCVILAAGKGTRMAPLTYEIPKPMVKVRDKTLLEHKFDILPKEIDEIILVVGYLGHHIKEFFKNEYKGIPIRYVLQEELEGTGKAIWCAKEFLDKPFLVLMGDDLYSKKDLKNLLQYQWAILVKQVQGKCSGGLMITNEDGTLKEILEGEHEVKQGCVNAAAYILQRDFFNYPLVKLPHKEEWGLPQTIVNISNDFPVHLVKATYWEQLTSQEDVLRLNL